MLFEGECRESVLALQAQFWRVERYARYTALASTELYQGGIYTAAVYQ